MDTYFESELKGSSIEANAAKLQIAKYFKRCEDSDHDEARKHQLTFASKIAFVISKCANKHSDIYCNIITEIFSDKLCPQSTIKYWTLYIDCMQYFHYLLVCDKDFEKASLIYRHILSYSNKLQNTENCLTCVNIYCVHLLLQKSLQSKNQQQAISEATDVVENLTKLFKEILDANTKSYFQYPDILKKTLLSLFPQNKAVTVYQFLKHLPKCKIKEMFQSLFRLSAQQNIDTDFTTNDVQAHAKFLMETIYSLLKVDIIDKLQMQLSVQLLEHCRGDFRLQSNKTMSEFLDLLCDYLTLLFAQESTIDFQRTYIGYCERFMVFFEKYSKSLWDQAWSGDLLIIIFYFHAEMQNVSIFSCFWKQMIKPDCFGAMLKYFVELIKLAPHITSESKLLTISCCTSIRKHVILSFAQIALTALVFYCQNVSEEDELKGSAENNSMNTTDYYKEMIRNNVLLVINHAFKIIEKMDCITSISQEISIILARIKQVIISCRTSKQADTCISICELLLKIKTKIAGKEWPVLLRYLYKTVTQLKSHTPHIGREIQMCYIVSMLQDTICEVDLNQIRTQICLFYATKTASATKNEQQEEHQQCLLHLYYTTSSPLKPHLDTSRKKLLHWLDSQHILKYHKSNISLLHSIIKSSQSNYEFILLVKLSKQQTYAMAKINSLYKTLKTKDSRSRLEQLTFGHMSIMLLNEMTSNHKLQADSKELNEDQLENLFMRKDISAITINNDLKRFELAWKAFKAFEDFYEKFDNENIAMDDAIIDWESLLDDLSGLAIHLQISGYMEHSSQVWLLHYKCSRLVQDDISALRGLTFFCEYSDYHEKLSNDFKLDEEMQCNFPTIIHGLENLKNLQKQAHQSYILLAVLQIAHYYARSSRFSFAQMLFQYVERKHAELNERQGHYDIVLATMDAIKFRLLWKYFDDTNATVEEKASRTVAGNMLLHRCLLHVIEETLDRFHNFSFISSCDCLLYQILIINLVQELAECAINRLCDNFITSFFIVASKASLMMGLALRFVQVMSMWMWMNLQMEYVDKAQVKLKIILCVMGMRSLAELTEKCSKSCTEIQSNTLLPKPCVEFLTPSRHNTALEAIRKLSQAQLSPVTADKLQLSPSHRNFDLKRYFDYNSDTKLLPQNEQIEWTIFMVGCLNARLCFLVENYDQLEAFYERCSNWLQMRTNCFNKKYYKNIELMAMQHYANFLRARGQYDKAVKCLEYGIELCETKSFDIDAVYSVNFKLQLVATQKEMNNIKNINFKFPTHSKLRRALQFNISPESEPQQTPAKRNALECKILENVMASGKSSSEIIKPLFNNATDGGCSTSRKIKPQLSVDLTGSSGSCSSVSSLDLKSKKLKPKFKICEDSLDIATNAVKCVKRAKDLEENELMYKTPRVARKTTKISKTTATKSSVKFKRPENIPKFHININLADSPITSSKKSSTYLLENLESQENLDSNKLIAKMHSLEIGSPITTKTLAREIETKNVSSVRKPKSTKKPEAVTIVLEDSPCKKESQLEFADKEQSKKDKSPVCQLSIEHNLASSSRLRRKKKLVPDDDDKPTLENDPPLISSKTTTPIVTRRRQKNLV